MTTDGTDWTALAQESRAWPFEEARKVVDRISQRPIDRPVLFETGYGPSGLPHIGTFGEVARTTMVRHAFEVLTGGRVPTRLLCFSDDMDGLRKIPGNLPNPELLEDHVEKRDAAGNVVRHPSPLTSVPDPFGTHDSFGQHNNARLRGFLDSFGFDYEFASSTEIYASGAFDDTLRLVLERHRKVTEIVLPLLGEERRGTYCPFLPVVETWNGETRRQVLHFVTIVETRPADGIAVFRELNAVTGEPVGEPFEHSVLGGACKLQWRPDWALRWTALGVDYEMSGKDLIDSVTYAGRICEVLDGTPPEGFNYELFLDDTGKKISKSKGNGITIDEWLRYASPESLSLFMYQSPRKAKRLYFDVIPKNVDEYLIHRTKFAGQEPARQVENPVWHIHSGAPPLGAADEVPISFAMLLNLVSASNSEDRDVLWGFIRRYAPGANPQSKPRLDQLVGYAIAYFQDFVKPTKRFREPDEIETAALKDLAARLGTLAPDADSESIQSEVLDVARGIERYQDAKRTGPDGRPGVSAVWFSALYQLLLGQERGPRFGSFVALYGIEETRALIERALAGALASETV